MPKCSAVSRLYVRVWSRTLASNPWALASAVAALILTTGLLYMEAGPALVGAGFPGLLFLFRAALIGSFMTCALVDLGAFGSGRMRGFPRWIPVSDQEYVLGISLPAVILLATVTTCFAGALLARSLSEVLGYLMVAVALFVNVIAVSFLGLVCGMAASYISRALGRKILLLRVVGKIAVLLFIVVLLGLALFVPTAGWDHWFHVDVAMAVLLTAGVSRGILPAVSATVVLVFITFSLWKTVGGSLLRHTEVQEFGPIGRTQVSVTFPRYQVLAISMLELFRTTRDRFMVWYVTTVFFFFLGLIGVVGRQVLTLQNSPAFLLMAFYMMIFLVASIPLRSIGHDLPLKWFWSALPVRRSTYILGKYLMATLLPGGVLLAFLVLALLAGGLKIESGIGGLSDLLAFGIVAYGLAFFWGTFQPYQRGDLSSEFSQIGGFSISALLVFRALSAIQPLIGQARWVPALGILALLYGVSLAIEERRDGEVQY